MKKKSPKLFKTIFYFLIVFIVGELTVRILNSINNEPFWAFPDIVSKNEKLVYELNPKYRGINSFGMRQREFDLKELQGKYLIAVIGDSHTYSIKVKNAEDAFPQKIEYYLNHALSEDNVRVLNFGVPGYNTAQELELLKQKVLKFNPNLVILQYSINDIHICNYIQPENKLFNSFIHNSELLTFLWRIVIYHPSIRKYTVEYIGKNFPDGLIYKKGLVGTLSADISGENDERRLHPARTKDRVPARYHYMLSRENWEKHIDEFARLCKNENIALIATGFISQSERDFFIKEGFNVYSFYDIFANIDMGLYGYKNSKDHFDVAGCDYIGKKLAAFIKNRNF